jgi:hypothetical protein
VTERWGEIMRCYEGAYQAEVEPWRRVCKFAMITATVLCAGSVGYMLAGHGGYSWICSGWSFACSMLSAYGIRRYSARARELRNQSYTLLLSELATGIEPAASCLPSRRSTK